MLDDLHPFWLQVLLVYSEVSSQVIVAGMGEVLGLEHTAIHAYLQMLGFDGLEYQLLFSKVVEVDGRFRKELTKHKQMASRPSPPPPEPTRQSTRQSSLPRSNTIKKT